MTIPQSNNKRWEQNAPQPASGESREVLLGLRYDKGNEPLIYWLSGAFFAALCTVIVTGFAAIYVTNERYVYFWDYALYWNFFKNLGSMLCSDWIQALGSIIRSVREWDYNYLAVLPIAPVECFFGDSRLTYTVAVALLLVLPTAFLGARVVVLFNPDQRPRPQAIVFAIATLFFLLLHPVWIPVFEGRPDIIGLAFAFGILTIYMRRPLGDQSLSVLVVIGVLLAVVFLVRRWYAYWIIAFFPAVFVADALRLPSKAVMKGLRRTALSLALIGAAFAATVWSVATPVMLRIFATDYSDTYSAYKISSGAGGCVPASHRLFRRTADCCCRIRAGRERVATLDALPGCIPDRSESNLIVAFLPCEGFQSASLLLAFADSVSRRKRSVRSPVRDHGAEKNANDRGDSGIGVHNRFLTLLPQATRFPKMRADFNQLGTLTVELEKQYRASPGKIYVIASSVRLNDDILRNFCREASVMSLNCEDIVPVNHVDKRDGFPHRLLTESIQGRFA